MRAIIRDALLLLPLVGLVVFLVALSRFRSVRWTLILVACLVWSITLTAGFAAALGYALNPLTQIFPILLLIIGIADGVHLVERVAEAGNEGTDLSGSWGISLAETGSACVLTTATTAIGFLALFTTSIPVLHEFALIVSVGVCFSLLANLFVLPALCLRFCRKPPSIAARRGALFARIAAYSHRHGAVVLVAGAVMLGASLQQYGQVEVDFFLSKVLSDENAVSDGNSILLRQFGGSIPLEVTVETTEGDFHDPEHLESLLALSGFLEERGWQVASQATALGKIRAVFTGEEKLPSSREESAQLSLTLEAAKLAPLLGDEQRVARLTAIGPDIGGQKLLELQTELKTFAANLPSIRVTAVGSMLAAAEGFGSLVHELIIGLFVALVAVIALIGLTLRSARAALASALPNSLPIALGLAFFALTGRYLDIFSAVFFTIALGIAVDDTIHMLSRFQLERSRSDNEAQALERAASHVGTAVADTSWILMSGFALLMLSNFPANRLSGGLAAGLIGAALLCDIILVPAGIRVFRLGAQRS